MGWRVDLRFGVMARCLAKKMYCGSMRNEDYTPTQALHRDPARQEYGEVHRVDSSYFEERHEIYHCQYTIELIVRTSQCSSHATSITLHNSKVCAGYVYNLVVYAYAGWHLISIDM